MVLSHLRPEAKCIAGFGFDSAFCFVFFGVGEEAPFIYFIGWLAWFGYETRPHVLQGGF